MEWVSLDGACFFLCGQQCLYPTLFSGLFAAESNGPDGANALMGCSRGIHPAILLIVLSPSALGIHKLLKIWNGNLLNHHRWPVVRTRHGSSQCTQNCGWVANKLETRSDTGDFLFFTAVLPSTGIPSGPVTFIDRDPVQFRNVLEYLRHGDEELIRLLSRTTNPGLRREFVFYNLDWKNFDCWW